MDLRAFVRSPVKSKLRVLALICDGASTNKKFINMHTCSDESSDVVYVTKNLASGEERDLFFIIDPPHLLKTLRKCFANSYAHRKTRKLWKEGQDISWEAITTLHEVTLKQKYRDTKLTRDHVRLNSYSCMSVVLASQVMSNSVVTDLKKHRNDSRFKNLVNDQLLRYIKLVNDFFDCLNGDGEGERVKENDFLKSYDDIGDTRIEYLKSEVLAFFEDWEIDVLSRWGNFSKTVH